MLGNKILLMLKEEISQLEYERYIKRLQYDEIHSKVDFAIFNAPNPFIANWVKTKYGKKLSQLFEMETGMKTEVEIRTQKQKFIKPPKPIISEQPPSSSTKINPTYTFENFVVGSSNQFAYTAAYKVAEKPGKVYNPLFLYGGVGLGKTHLLHAIGNLNIKQNRIIIYATIEQFMNDFTYHLRHKTIEKFRAKYRKCDILLIDDIQFLSGKEGTQEEFFHTFNELHTEGKQIVLTSDQPPQKIIGLEDRLKSRFEWGLIADIQPPELETKIAIIKKKCELNGIYLSEEIINYLAANMDSNIREIEGVILKLNAYSSLVNQQITMELANNVLNEQRRELQKDISLKEIVDTVAIELNVKPSEIKSKSKKRQIVKARRIVIYLARTLTPNSMPQLAQFFGMKDHTSVSHTMKKVKEMMEKDSSFKLEIDELIHKIQHSRCEKL